MHRNKENPLKEALLVKEEGIWMTAFSHLLSAFSQDTPQRDKTLKTIPWISYTAEPSWAVFVDFFFNQGVSANYVHGHYSAEDRGGYGVWNLASHLFPFPFSYGNLKQGTSTLLLLKWL